jgi:hypothetical protein
MIQLLATLSVALLFSSQVFAAACPSSSSKTTIQGNGSCSVTGTQSTIQLNFNSGFDASTRIDSIDGNNGTTVGAQRKLSFIKAAEILTDQVASSETIIVDARFSALKCNANSAILGSAGASSNLAYPSDRSGVTANTFYPIALLNSIMGSDTDTTESDVTAQFNSNIGNSNCLQGSNGWYYGFATPSQNFIGFTTVLLHEITHGLGFASLTNASSGEKSSGLDDIFSNFLFSLAGDADWSIAGGLTNRERAASAVSGTGLLWTGINTNTKAQGLLTAGFNDVNNDEIFGTNDRIQMYAPNPFKGGSSVSHFNTALSPNELMEPQYTEGQYTLGLAIYLLKDIGWSVSPPPTISAPMLSGIGNQSAPQNTNLTVNLFAFDSQGDPLNYSVISDPNNVTSLVGSTLTLRKSAIGSYSVTVQVSDGGLTDEETFTFTTYAEPSISTNSILLNPNDSINIGDTATSINIDNVNKNYSYGLTFKGNNANSLLNKSGNNLNIEMPPSGQFAGEYVLTFTDSNTGTTYDFTLRRDPRLVISASKLLSDQSIQTLNIEGGAPNTIYTLISSESALTFIKNNNSVTSVSADGDATSFYSASLVLGTENVNTSTRVTVSVNSVYDTVNSTGITIEPKRTHVLSFKDINNTDLKGVATTLNTRDLDAYNLAPSYISSTQGKVNITLPENATDYSAIASLTNYSNLEITLDDSVLSQTIVMEKMSDPILLTGNITAISNLSFANELPVITLTLNDDSEINIPATKTKNSLAEFSYTHDLLNGSVSSLKITHSQGIDIDLDINTSNDISFDLIMKLNTKGATKTESSGGSLNFWYAIFLFLGLTRRPRIKQRPF